MTIGQATSEAVRILTDAGFEQAEARRDVSVLARHLLGWNLADWAARSRQDAPTGLAEKLNAHARRRATHEPVAYITGVREFYGREFVVSPAVLIPRPETEGLIERALPVEGTVVDVGTGSGCVAITLALACPRARVIATDVSTDALAIARENASRLGARVEFLQASLVPADLKPDVIVSNPPYVPERDRASLSIDVRDFEPAGALFAGPDGLDVIRALVPAARRA